MRAVIVRGPFDQAAKRGGDGREVLDGLNDANEGYEKYIRPSRAHAHFSAKSKDALVLIGCVVDAAAAKRVTSTAKV